jgi:hypothetical protein
MKEELVSKRWVLVVAPTLFALALAPVAAQSAAKEAPKPGCTAAAWFTNLSDPPGNILQDHVISGHLWVRTESSSYTTNMAAVVQVH